MVGPTGEARSPQRELEAATRVRPSYGTEEQGRLRVQLAGLAHDHVTHLE